ncbi:MAG TPA: condensation domain-containing protein, partial [Thermoanaerobaculia bacterium]|nr:condensation domain-containing protein [Thermoanaerobaculia bacterium]
MFGRVDLSGLPPEVATAAVTAAASRLQASLDLARGPLCRVCLFDLGEGREQRLLWIVHHLAVDVLSWRFLLEDLEVLYRTGGGAAALPAKTTSFRAWAERLRERARDEERSRERDHWLDAAWRRVPPLPVDAPGASRAWGRARAEVRWLEPEVAGALLHELPGAARVQVRDLLLAALADAVRAWTGEPRVVVDLEGHGREAGADDVDLSRTVGWFTSIYPVLLDLEGVGTEPAATLRAVKEGLRRVPGNGFVYGLLRYLGEASLQEELASLPRAEILFLYTRHGGQPEGALAAPAPESAGPARSPRVERSHLLEIAAGFEGERLRVEWTWSPDALGPEVVPRLMKRFEEALRGLVEICRRAAAAAITPSDFPLAELDVPEIETLHARYRGVADVVALSPVQEGLLFHTLYQPGSGVYVTHAHWTLRGDLDVAALRKAWQHVVDRHPALRSAFAWERLRRPVQVILREVDVAWREHDWRHAGAREERFEALLRADRAEGFQVDRPPLMRLHLLWLENDLHRLVWTFHHLALDGWSVHLIFREVVACYGAFRRGGRPPLAEARSYRDYIAWLKGRDLSRAESFWRRALDGWRRPVPLPGALEQAPPETPVEGSRVRRSLALAPETGDALRALARAHRLTLNSVAQGAWGLLLAAHADSRRDVVFGTVTSGRPESLQGVESMVGVFINTLPVRLAVDPAAVLIEWLRDLQERQVEMREFEYTPLVEIQGWTKVPRGQPL